MPTLQDIPRNKQIPTWSVLVAIAFVYLLLAGANAATKAPWGDEGFYSSPGLDLITRGQMGVPVMEPTGSGVIPGVIYTDVNRNIYVGSVLHYLASAAWYKVVGFSVLSMRGLAMLWGAVLLAAWYHILRYLSRNSSIALLGTGFMAVNHLIVDAASDGRPDIVCAALGAAALAAYLGLRDRNLRTAILVSHMLLAAAAAVHPLALLYFAAVLLATVYFDWRRIRWRHLVFAGIPYVIVFAFWGVYISTNPHAALAQARLLFGARMEGRTGFLARLRNEIADRYLEAVYWAPYSTGVMRVKALLLAFYALAIAGPLASARIRGRREYRFLMFLWLTVFLLLALLGNYKPYYYLVHILPIYCALLAIWLVESPEAVLPARPGVWVLAGVYVAMNLAWTSYNVHRDPWHHEYAGAVRVVKDRAGPQDLIMGPPQMGYALGFYGNLIDDATLGYSTGKRPRWVIADERGYVGAFENYPATAPLIAAHVKSILSDDLHLVYENRLYRVYGPK